MASKFFQDKYRLYKISLAKKDYLMFEFDEFIIPFKLDTTAKTANSLLLGLDDYILQNMDALPVIRKGNSIQTSIFTIVNLTDYFTKTNVEIYPSKFLMIELLSLLSDIEDVNSTLSSSLLTQIENILKIDTTTSPAVSLMKGEMFSINLLTCLNLIDQSITQDSSIQTNIKEILLDNCNSLVNITKIALSRKENVDITSKTKLSIKSLLMTLSRKMSFIVTENFGVNDAKALRVSLTRRIALLFDVFEFGLETNNDLKVALRRIIKVQMNKHKFGLKYNKFVKSNLSKSQLIKPSFLKQQYGLKYNKFLLSKLSKSELLKMLYIQKLAVINKEIINSNLSRSELLKIARKQLIGIEATELLKFQISKALDISIPHLLDITEKCLSLRYGKGKQLSITDSHLINYKNYNLNMQLSDPIYLFWESANFTAKLNVISKLANSKLLNIKETCEITNPDLPLSLFNALSVDLDKCDLQDLKEFNIRLDEMLNILLPAYQKLKLNDAAIRLDSSNQIQIPKQEENLDSNLTLSYIQNLPLKNLKNIFMLTPKIQLRLYEYIKLNDLTDIKLAQLSDIKLEDLKLKEKL